MKVDILAFAAHPDDVELSCCATIMKHIDAGFSAAIVDLTRGELGTRGNADLRDKEAQRSSEILKISDRKNVKLPDGFFNVDEQSRLEVIKIIRYYQPRIILANARSDRHPDHGRASLLVSEAAFYSGLRKIKTEFEGAEQKEWRPEAVYHYIQDRYMKPSFVVDVTKYVDRKLEAIKAFSSQFYDPQSTEPSSPISGHDFFDFVKARMKEMGRQAGFEYAEGFVVERIPGVETLFDLK